MFALRSCAARGVVSSGGSRFGRGGGFAGEGCVVSNSRVVVPNSCVVGVVVETLRGIVLLVLVPNVRPGSGV